MLRAVILALLLATPATADPIRLKILTFNIWYGGDQVNFDSVIKAIRLADADVVGLQEPDGKTLEIARLAGYPDPTHLGITWTAGHPWPYLPANETFDRIDFVWTANMQPLESLIMGEADNAQNGLQVMPWSSDHRAVLTTVAVTPMDAPPLIAVEPRPVRQGDSLVLRVVVPSGTPYTAMIMARGTDKPLTGIADVDPADRPTIRLSSADLPVGDYDAVLSTDGKELAHTRFSVVAPDGKATLTVTAKVVTGGDISLDFRGSQGFKLDWIGIYKAGEPSVYNYLGFAYTGARINGTLTFPAVDLYKELIPGDYEARLMFDDHYEVLATAPFTVTAP